MVAPGGGEGGAGPASSDVAAGMVEDENERGEVKLASREESERAWISPERWRMKGTEETEWPLEQAVLLLLAPASARRRPADSAGRTRSRRGRRVRESDGNKKTKRYAVSG